jgi:transposase
MRIVKHDDIKNAALGYHCSVLFPEIKAMRKLQIEDAEVTRIAIQQEIERSQESRYDHRLHGLLLVTAGHSCREVAALFGENGTTVQRWVNRFEEGGLDALRDGERSGRPRTLDAKDWRKLQSDLRKTPRNFDLAATLWDGPVLSEHLRRRYGVVLGVRQCQRLFCELGFRLRKPRPQVVQSDPLKVAAVKKTPKSGSSSRGYGRTILLPT